MRTRTVVYAAVTALLVVANQARAHCDSMNGPVVQAAKNALEAGDFATVQIWVGQDQQAELERVFDKARTVRTLGGDAQDLADRYFFETAVRLHRQAEGMAYTGLKPAGPMPPDIQAAEKALEKGDQAIVVDVLVSELREKVGTWFDQALAARKEKDAGIEKGRQWVDAYVKYVVYVHSLYQKIQSGPAHGVGN